MTSDQLPAATDPSDTEFINMYEVILLKKSNLDKPDIVRIKSIPGELFSFISYLEERSLKIYSAQDRIDDTKEQGRLEGQAVYMYHMDGEAFRGLSSEEHHLLRCIKPFPHRLNLLENEAKFNRIKNLNIGDLVMAFDNQTWHTGRLRYKGTLPLHTVYVIGTWFGVELLGESVGKGRSDGIVSGTRLFQTASKCAVIVHAACIRPDVERACAIPGPVVADVSGLSKISDSDQLVVATDRRSTFCINMWEVSTTDLRVSGLFWSIPGELVSLMRDLESLDPDHKSYSSHERKYMVDETLNIFIVHAIDSPAFKELTPQEYRLLLCIKIFPERLDLVKNEAKFSTIKNMVIGDVVKAFYDNTWHTGRLRYNGALPQSSTRQGMDEDVSGTWFGVELVGASVGKGKSNGMVYGVRFFQTAAKSAVFVHAACIRLDEEPAVLPSASSVPTVVNMPGVDKAVEMFNIRADLLSRYGKKTHEGHIKEAKKLPGISWVQFNEHNTECSIEGSNVDSCRHARTTIELFQELYRLPNKYLAKFTDKNYKKINDIRKMSNAVITGDEMNEFYTLFRLIGLSSEVRRALEAFESEVAKLAVPQPLASASSTNLPSTSGGGSASGSGNGDAGGKKRKTGSNAGSNPGPSGLNQVRQGNSANQNVNLEGRLPVGMSRMDISEGPSGGHECIVCMMDEAVMALSPCGHKQTCPKCADKLFKGNKKECPTCRKPIKNILRIYD